MEFVLLRVLFSFPLLVNKVPALEPSSTAVVFDRTLHTIRDRRKIDEDQDDSCVYSSKH